MRKQREVCSQDHMNRDMTETKTTPENRLNQDQDEYRIHGKISERRTEIQHCYCSILDQSLQSIPYLDRPRLNKDRDKTWNKTWKDISMNSLKRLELSVFKTRT